MFKVQIQNVITVLNTFCINFVNFESQSKFVCFPIELYFTLFFYSNTDYFLLNEVNKTESCSDLLKGETSSL